MKEPNISSPGLLGTAGLALILTSIYTGYYWLLLLGGFYLFCSFMEFNKTN